MDRRSFILFQRSHDQVRQVRGPSLYTATWVYIVVALAVGFGIPSIDKVLPPSWVSPVSKSTMEAILGAIAAGMITLSGLVFSLVFVLFQFGSSNYGPRIVAVFAGSHILRHALGVFTGTFLFALMALRAVGMRREQAVSDFPAWVAFAWLLGSIVVLALLIQLFGSMRISALLPILGRIAEQSISHSYGAYAPGRSSTTEEDVLHTRERQGFSVQEVIYEGEPAYITGFNRPLLISLARNSDSVIVIPYAIGDAVKVGTPLALISGTNPAVTESGIFAAIELGHERSLRNDPKYPIRLLADIGIRALSPGINDPTTAVQALDHIEPLLHRIGNSDLDAGVFKDSDDVVRLVVKTATWEDYLQLGLCEILQYGATSIQVQRRLEAVLIYLLQSVPPERAEAVRRFGEQRRSVASVSFPDTTFRQWADMADREGIGGGIRGAGAQLSSS
jgi:uncharacterized membrane protein